MDKLFIHGHQHSCRSCKLKRGNIVGDREGMGSKGRRLTMLELCMGFKTRHVVRFVYILVVLLFMVTFLGNVVSIGATTPWHTAFFHLISLSQPTKSHPLRLVDCRQVNVTTFEKTLMMYANDDSLYQNVTNISRIKKLFLDNEKTLSWTNQRIISAVEGNSSVEQIHSIFRDILLTRAVQHSYKAEAAKDILPTVKIPMDEHYRKRGSKFLGTTYSQSDRYESCAVVGNSGVLQNSLRGPEIDKHQVVIRLNNAVPKHLNQTMTKAHIGTKTTLTFMNSHVLNQCLRTYRSCNCHPYGVEVPIMVYLCIPDHAISVACCSFEHQTPIFLTDGRFDAFVSRIALWYSLKHFLNNGNGRGTANLTKWENAHRHEFHYSSGFQAVIVALALCEKVDLYGFGKHPKTRHHFHTSQRREHYAHDFEGEYLFYDDLEANKLYENPFLCQAGIGIPEVNVFH